MDYFLGWCWFSLGMCIIIKCIWLAGIRDKAVNMYHLSCINSKVSVRVLNCQVLRWSIKTIRQIKSNNRSFICHSKDARKKLKEKYWLLQCSIFFFFLTNQRVRSLSADRGRERNPWLWVLSEMTGVNCHIPLIILQAASWLFTGWSMAAS